MKQQQPIAIKKLRGIHNLLRPELQPWGSCYDAANVLVDEAYRVERRDGYLRAVAFDKAGDLYGAYQHSGLYAIEDGELLTLSDTLVPTLIKGDLTDTRVQWAELGSRVFYAGSVDAGVIVDRTYWQPLRIPVPAVTVTSADGSDRAPGQYQITATYTHTATGLEGPATPVVRADLVAGKTFNVSVATLAGHTAKVYVTETNGSVLYCNGVPLSYEQRDAQALPSGITALAAGGGVLYAAIYDGTNDVGFVFWSQVFYFSCWRMDTDYLAVPGKVVALAALPQGVLIGSTSGIWLWDGETLHPLTDYGTVEGRPLMRDDQSRFWLWTQRGLGTLTAEGWKNLTEDHVLVPPGTWCTTAVVGCRGQSYALVRTDGLGTVYPYQSLAGKCWAIHLATGEMTRFTNFDDFKAFGVLKGRSFGLRAEGLYLFGGEKDQDADDPTAETPIVASLVLHPTDFGDDRLKYCTYTYLLGCDDATLTVHPSCDESLVGSCSGRRRIPLSRGRKGQFWAFEIDDGYSDEPLRLTGLEFLVEPTTRRI